MCSLGSLKTKCFYLWIAKSLIRLVGCSISSEYTILLSSHGAGLVIFPKSVFPAIAGYMFNRTCYEGP